MKWHLRPPAEAPQLQGQGAGGQAVTRATAQPHSPQLDRHCQAPRPRPVTIQPKPPRGSGGSFDFWGAYESGW